MQRKQKTIDSYLQKDKAEPQGYEEAPSIGISKSAEGTPYDNLIPLVISDENIDTALEHVVKNRGSPGVDGMSVHELGIWIKSHREELQDAIEFGNYMPSPVRRKEIPKDNGTMRNLGIPTVKDRLVAQMINQVLSQIYEPTFSDFSFGFRPGRSPIDAVNLEKEYYDQGYKYAVGIDLEKFFDHLNQQFLMNILRERIKDRVLILLIKRFLRAGVVLPNGILEATYEGSPQGSPLSPLLSNIYLDKLDKELDRRGHKYIRFADDSLILVKTPRACERVRDSITHYIEDELKLKVNREKTEIGSLRNLKFLGFKLTRLKAGTGITIHQKSLAKFKKKVIVITKRNRGVSLDSVILDLNEYTKGWIGYYGACSSNNSIKILDGWMRRRVRQYQYKLWKKKANRYKQLLKLAPPDEIGPCGSISTDWRIKAKGASKHNSYWRGSDSPAVKQGLSIAWLKDRGMFFLMDDWETVKERCTNRPLRSRMVGGVRGQPTV